MFQLTAQEVASLRSQLATSKTGRGGRRYRPYAFTEQGVAMLSTVLNSERAIQVNIEIMRAFVRLRQMLTSNAELARKLAEPERKYDAQFKVVFDAIRQLMTPPLLPRAFCLIYLVEEKAAPLRPAVARTITNAVPRLSFCPSPLSFSTLASPSCLLPGFSFRRFENFRHLEVCQGGIDRNPVRRWIEVHDHGIILSPQP